MNNIKQIFLRLFSLFTTAMLLACSTSSSALWPAGIYHFDAISGTVLDKETRKPIEGVVVVGHWGLERQLIMGSSYTGPLVVKETVTDKDGKFTLPASVETDINKRGHFNGDMYPEIAFFKREYDFTVYRHNGERPMSRPPESPRKILNPDEYLMPKWVPGREALIEKMFTAASAFSLTYTSDPCADFQVLTPLLLAALRAEYDRIILSDRELAKHFAQGHRLYRMENCIDNLRDRRK